MSHGTRRPPTPRKRSVGLLSALLAGLIALVAFVVPGITGSGSTPARSAATSAKPAPAAAPAPSPAAAAAKPVQPSAGSPRPSNRDNARLRAIGFRSDSRFSSHFAKHGREFGNVSRATYLSMAQDLRDAPLSPTVIETMQRGGTISRFNRSNGSFIAFDRDLTIRTFFKPDDGEDYFWRAARQNH